MTKEQVLKWLRETAALYVDDGEFALHLNAAASLIEGGVVEPKARRFGYSFNGATLGELTQTVCKACDSQLCNITMSGNEIQSYQCAACGSTEWKSVRVPLPTGAAHK